MDEKYDVLVIIVPAHPDSFEAVTGLTVEWAALGQDMTLEAAQSLASTTQMEIAPYKPG